MKRLLICIFFLNLAFFSNASMCFSQCGTVANDFSMTLPCVEFDGIYYKLTLTSYANPADQDRLYWKYESMEVSAPDTNCAHVNTALQITAPCVYYAGINLSMILEYYINPDDPTGLYWKLSQKLTINPVNITKISGDTSVCFDSSYYSSPEFLTSLNEAMACIMRCDNDAACLVSCMPDLGMGSAFNLAFTFYNPTASLVEFIISAGAYYNPGTSDVQPMLIIIDQILTIEPGYVTLCIPTYCMDGYAHAPSDEDVFGTGDIAQQPCIIEILDLLRGKGNISHADSSIIQEAVWTCTETGSITTEQQTALENM